MPRKASTSTATARDELRRLVDRLPDADLGTARRILEALAASAEYDDKPLSPEEEAALEEGLRDIRAGRVRPLDEVLPPHTGQRRGR